MLLWTIAFIHRRAINWMRLLALPQNLASLYRNGMAYPILFPFFFYFISYNIFRTPMPILNCKEQLVTVLAGCLNDDSWPDLSRQAVEMLEQTHRRCKIPAKAGHHAGDILQPFNAGFHMAMGRRYPETCRTTSQMTRFWHNSPKSPHSSICPGLQPVSTVQTRIHSAMTASSQVY